MKLTREVTEALPSIIALLPGEGEWCVCALNCRDGVYIGTTHHLPWRLYKLVTGAEGSSAAVRMAGGPAKARQVDACRHGAGSRACGGGVRARRQGEPPHVGEGDRRRSTPRGGRPRSAHA